MEISAVSTLIGLLHLIRETGREAVFLFVAVHESACGP
jgi:hypothetical protein